MNKTSLPEKPFYHRPELADKLAALILDDSPTTASSSGIFFSAPRRTGKTTFMRSDLTPALLAKSAYVIYVDLWEDPKAEPSQVIVSAIRGALAKHDGAIKRLAKSVGIGGAKVVGIEFSLDRIGFGQDISIVQALAALSDVTQQTIVLILDEAQHAITTSEGVNAMFSLKAARDELNSGLHYGLRVVCTGSNQDKLAMLRNSKDQAFFGAPLVPFPSLGSLYIDWFCNNVKGLPAALVPSEVMTLFVRAAYRPEILGAAVDALRYDFELEADQVKVRFNAAIEAQIKNANDDQMRVIKSLTPLQSSVLLVLAAAGTEYAPFESATMDQYRLAAQKAGQKDINIELGGVQQALAALQDKGLVWKAARGVYALEEHAVMDLLRERGLL